MSPVDELEQEIRELGARAKLHQLDEKRAELDDQRSELFERYPFLIAVSSAPRFSSIIEDAKRFRDSQPNRSYRTYDEEFKQAALKRLQDGEYLSDVARSVNVTVQLLSVWATKAGVRIAKMPPEETARRLKAGREGNFLALPAPKRAVPAKKVRASKPRPKADGPRPNGSKQIADEKGREILRAMPDGAAIHLDEISAKTQVRKDNVNWRLMRRAEDGHVKKLDQPAMWMKTKEGKAWQDKAPT